MVLSHFCFIIPYIKREKKQAVAISSLNIAARKISNRASLSIIEIGDQVDSMAFYARSRLQAT